MRIADQLRSVRHTFASNRLRAFLTLLGIIIGAGTIVLLASLLHAGREVLEKNGQRANEADLMQIRADAPRADEANKTRRNLSRGDVDMLAESPLLGGAPVASESGRDVWVHRPIKKRIRIVAAQPETAELYHLEVEKGRALAPDDMRERRHVAVVGHEVWEKVLEERADISDAVLEVEGQEWAVVGVLKSKPIIGGGGANDTWMWNRKVLVPHSTYDSHYAQSHDVGRIYVRLAGAGSLHDRLRTVEDVVKAMLLRRHYEVHNFKIEGEEGGLSTERLIQSVIAMLLFSTAILALFVGGINIMNIMLVTVTERTREIGVRRAIGAPPSTIMIQFLLEASLIALTGGLIGVGGGLGLAWLASLVLGHALGGWPFYIEPWSIALGLGLSILVGVIFGLFPAWRASRLDPVEALRFE